MPDMHAEGLRARELPPGRLLPDNPSLVDFAEALFRYADAGTYASLRAFQDSTNKVFRIRAVRIAETGPASLAAPVREMAAAAANADQPVVFCPPICTFHAGESATERDLANGLALSLECDERPEAARDSLESLLGPATVVVASGGEWMDPNTGVFEPKLHLHWRLTEPTRSPADHARLKRARVLATALVGGDASNKPVVHPIRWPGSWHRKGAPRLATILALNGAREIELDDALTLLEEAARAQGIGQDRHRASGDTAGGSGEARQMAELIRAIVSGQDYHSAIVALSMRYLKGGMADAQAVETIRGFLLAVPPELRDAKGGQQEKGRWQARYDDVPRAVSTARRKLGSGPASPPKEDETQGSKPTDADGWPDPVDFLSDPEDLTGAPELRPEHIPAAVAPFVFDTAGRMGVDAGGVALAALVSCASVIPDEWAIQPKRGHAIERAEKHASPVAVCRVPAKPLVSLCRDIAGRYEGALPRARGAVLARGIPKPDQHLTA